MFRYRNLTALIDMNTNVSSIMSAIQHFASNSSSARIEVIHVAPRDLSDLDRRMLSNTFFGDENVKFQTWLRGQLKLKHEVEIIGRAVESTCSVDEIMETIPKTPNHMILLQNELINSAGRLCARLQDRAYCDVVRISSDFAEGISKIVVPVDFGPRSLIALDIACRFARTLNAPRVHALHIVDVPTGYSKLGQTWNEAAKAMLGVAQQRSQMFLQMAEKACTGVEVEEVFLLNRNPSRGLESYILTNQVDFLVMANSSRTLLSSVLLPTKILRNLQTTAGLSVLTVRPEPKAEGMLAVLMRRVLGDSGSYNLSHEAMPDRT